MVTPPLVPSIGIKPMFNVVILYLMPYLQASPPPGQEAYDKNHILVKIVLAAHIGVGKIMPGESGGEE